MIYQNQLSESDMRRVLDERARQHKALIEARNPATRDYRYHEVIRLAGEVITEAARADAVCSAGLKEREDVFVNMLLHQFRQLADELNHETKEIGV